MATKIDYSCVMLIYVTLFLQIETQNTKIFTDRHGFTSSELFSSSATSNSSSTRSLNEQLGDACDDDYDDRSSSGDEYCILEQDDEVSYYMNPSKS